MANKKSIRFRSRKTRAGKGEYKRTGDTSRHGAVTSDNYHKDSLKYMREKLGREPNEKEAVELDREWAENKISTSIAPELLMGSHSLNERTGKKKTLIGRQFQDVIDSGLADLKVTDIEGTSRRFSDENPPSPNLKSVQ